jgi:phage protein D
MPHHDKLHWPRIKIGGTPLSSECELLLDEVVVDHSMHLPDMFVIRLLDRNGKVLQDAGAEIGKPVVISASSSGGDVNLIDGEITSLEAAYESAGGAHCIIRGYDSSHRLHRGRTTQSYVNVKDSDIARRVAQRAGLRPGKIDNTSGTFDHVTQANSSDWEFLQSRAKPIGYEVAIVAGKLNFSKPAASSQAPGSGDYRSTDPLQLVFGRDLLEFRPRLSSAEQVSTVKVRGWDPKTKQAVIGSANAGTTSAKLALKPADMAGKFGSPTYTVVSKPLSKQNEVDAVAKATAEAIGSTMAEAEGVARGNPKLRAGAAVNISEVAAPFAGRYTLSHTRHAFAHDGYLVHFSISGRQERSLLGLASGGSNGSTIAGQQPIYGVVVAQVTDNNDPDKLGRVKLKFPNLSDDYESHWARVVQLGAGPNSGALFLPEKDDEVLVCFENGDFGHPYVIGGLYNDKDKPKLGSGLFDNGKVKRRGFVSRMGHKFMLFDDANKAGIALMTSDGKIKISLNETKKEINIICASGKITIKADGDLALKSGGNITMEAGKDVEVKGNNIKAAAQTGLQLKGTNAELAGDAKTTIKGGMVMIN